MEHQEGEPGSTNTRTNLDPDEIHARNVMGIKIQELIKDIENAHSQTGSGKKIEEKEE